MLTQAASPSVVVEENPQHRLAGLETKQDDDHCGVADLYRGDLAHSLIGAEHAGQLSPTASEAFRVVELAHAIIELSEDLGPTVRGERVDEVGGSFNRA